MAILAQRALSDNAKMIYRRNSLAHEYCYYYFCTCSDLLDISVEEAKFEKSLVAVEKKNISFFFEIRSTRIYSVGIIPFFYFA